MSDKRRKILKPAKRGKLDPKDIKAAVKKVCDRNQEKNMANPEDS